MKDKKMGDNGDGTLLEGEKGSPNSG